MDKVVGLVVGGFFYQRGLPHLVRTYLGTLVAVGIVQLHPPPIKISQTYIFKEKQYKLINVTFSKEFNVKL